MTGTPPPLAGWHRAVDRPEPTSLPLQPPTRPFPLWLFIAAPAAVLALATLTGWLGPDW